MLTEAADRVQGMMKLYNLLYLPGAGKSQALADSLPSLRDKMLAIYPAYERVSRELDIAELELSSARLSTLGIIVNELIANSMEHAFKDGASGRIRLVVMTEARLVLIRYFDDGAWGFALSFPL